MSEHTATVVYLVIAAINALITCWKTKAFFREPTLTLGLITASFFISVFVFAVASPLVYRVLGNALGRPSIVTLPTYLGILSCYAITHVLTILWTPPPSCERRALRRQVTLTAVAYAVVGIAMTVTFLSAHLPGPSGLLRFNVEHAGDPLIQLFLALFLGTLTCGTLGTWMRARRTKLADERLNHVLQCFTTSMLLVFGYVVCNVPAIVAAAVGHHELDALNDLGLVFGAGGALVTSYGMSGAAANAWIQERRDVRVLHPLWTLVVSDVNRGLSLTSRIVNGSKLTSKRFLLHRTVIEILDGMRALSRWARPELATAIEDLDLPDLSPREKRAIATAVMVRDAAARARAAEAESAHGIAGPVFPGDDSAASEQRGRLLDVARVLRHPMTNEVLRRVEAGTRGGATSRILVAKAR